MNKFEIPFGTGELCAKEMIVAEINSLRERLEALEAEPKPQMAFKLCVCDADYIGIHTKKCPMFGERVR